MKEIPLTKGKVALVDDADFEAVNAFKWYVTKAGRRFYAARGSKVRIYMHRFLMGPRVPGVDHRDGDGLNNQRENLRPATTAQNAQAFRSEKIGATSIYRGVRVRRHLRNAKWTAEIKVSGKKIHLGYFILETDAARAYDVASRKYFGEFASPNFP